MITTQLEIRRADSDDLDCINQIITAAVMNWDLPERVKRLSLPTCIYNDIDLRHYHVYLAIQQKQPIATLVLDNESVNMPGNKVATLIHGLYVHPDQQTRGIGRSLMQIAEQQATLKNADTLMVKAQKSAEGFFLRMGMQKLDIENENRDYPGRYWKSVS